MISRFRLRAVETSAARASMAGLPGRPAWRKAKREAGFTLLETLVAVFVLAALVSVVPRSLVTARTNLERSRDWLSARLVAETVLNEALVGSSLKPGAIGGEVDGRKWTATLRRAVTPAKEDGGEGPSRILLDVHVRVVVHGSTVLEVDTMRGSAAE